MARLGVIIVELDLPGQKLIAAYLFGSTLRRPSELIGINY
jgi:hypothetical protein